jgi:hypothetical protein
MQKNIAHAGVSHWTDATYSISGWRLYLHDIGTHISHQLRCIWPHQYGRQIQNTQARQRTAHDKAFM